MLGPQDFPTYDPADYTDIGYDDLLAYALHVLSEAGVERSFENLVAACQYIFPDKFSLRGYPHWPDSLQVNRSWLRCRTDKHLLVGSVREGFTLTPDGIRLAQHVEKALTGSGPKRPSQKAEHRLTEERTRAGRFVRAIEQSEAFQLYKAAGEDADISEFDLRAMLMCTMDSTPRTLRSNLEQLKQYAALYDREDVIEFLSLCEARFAHILSPAADGTTRGGMLPQRRT